jgi:heat shock protein HslJ
VVLLVVALVARDPASADDLQGTWILDDASMALLAGGAEVPAGVVATITFDDGQVGGSAGCNSFSGTYTVDGDELTISELAQTLIGCPPPLDVIEQAYTAALGEVTAYQVSGDSLVLTGGAALSYIREQPLPLEGTAWQLESIATGTDAVSSVVAPGSIIFESDGTVSGQTGCNGFNGGYTLEGNELTIGPLATTKMACPDDIGAQEAAVLAGLEGTATYAIDGQALSLIAADGSFLLGYRG